MVNIVDGLDGAGALRVGISVLVLFIALGSASFSSEAEEPKDKPVLKSEVLASNSKADQNKVNSENNSTNQRTDKGGVELDFSGLNFSDDSGMSPRKCGVLIPKIKY